MSRHLPRDKQRRCAVLHASGNMSIISRAQYDYHTDQGHLRPVTRLDQVHHVQMPESLKAGHLAQHACTIVSPGMTMSTDESDGRLYFHSNETAHIPNLGRPAWDMVLAHCLHEAYTGAPLPEREAYERRLRSLPRYYGYQDYATSKGTLRIETSIY